MTVGNLCDRLGFNIAETLVNLVKNPPKILNKDGELEVFSPEPEFIRKICVDLMPYVYPKLANIEVSGKDGDAIEILSRIIVLPAKEINAPTE